MKFDVERAAQATAFLALERGGKIDLITSVKLLYLADRLFMERYDLPLLHDSLVSMEHGPVDSNAYDYIKGAGGNRDLWEKYVNTIKKKNLVYLTRKMTVDDLDQLSKADRVVLKEVADAYKNLEPFELVNLVHKLCTEWEDVGTGSKPLSYERVFNALGKKNSNELADRVNEFSDLEEALVEAK
jgi:uncharacterized phage-associated protein